MAAAAAGTARDQAVAAAAGLNLPSVPAGGSGKALAVNASSSGYVLAVPARPPEKGLAWCPAVEERDPLGKGETHGEPVVTVAGGVVRRRWPAVPYREPVPAAVSRAQARVAQMRAGLLEPVNAAVTAQGSEAVDLWTGAVEVTRHGALVAAALGWTAEQLDDLFRAAGEITG